MSLQTTTHLNFGNGEAREALAFYESVFGGQTMVFTYDQMPGSSAEDAGKVVWGQVEADNGFRIMAYDVQADRAYEPGVNPVYVSVRSADEAEIRTVWGPLCEGARDVRVDLGPAAWAPLYGMVEDRFGVVWVLDVVAPYAG